MTASDIPQGVPQEDSRVKVRGLRVSDPLIRVRTMANFSSPPTDAQIIDAFATYAAERANAGVMVAKAVAEVEYDNGKVSVILDPARSGAEYWALIETSAYENLADFFGAPAAFDDHDGIWLRGRVSLIEVRDIDGRPLGHRSTAELNRIATGRGHRAGD